MLEKAASPQSKDSWREAVRNLQEAHTGAAPISFDMAQCFERHNLSVLQVFANTEAGLLFHGRTEHTGHTKWLKPLPEQKPYMLFAKTKAPEVYQLWLRADFPGLRFPSMALRPYPDDSSIVAWNTQDSFRKLPSQGEHDDLVTFVGREDDWLRCTNGTVIMAVELEDVLVGAMRHLLGYDRVRALTLIGHGRPALGVVLQCDNLTMLPPAVALKALGKVAERVNQKVPQHPAFLNPSHLIYSDAKNPIRMTLKGSLLRKQNEAVFGPALDMIMKST
jgi:hypothetical protein